MILPTLAKKIITEVRKLLDENLIIADTNGTIIASSDESRINKFHEGALNCYHERNKIIITKEDETKLAGVKAGVNLPIFYQKQIIGVIGITGDPNKVSPYGELLKKMTELLIKESYYSEQLDWQSRTLEAFVFDWVQKRGWSNTFGEQSKILGIDLSLDRLVIIGHYSSHKENFITRDVWNDIHQTFMSKRDEVFVRWGNDRFVLLHPVKEKENKTRTLYLVQQLQKYFRDKYNRVLSFGIGQTVTAHEIYQSFTQAERALAVAIRTQSIVFDEDLRLEMCIQDIKNQTRYELVHRTIAPIIKDTDLIDTLRTFILHNQSFKETADYLHIHINTLHYRLKKIQDATGLNPREVHDMMTLYLSLTFLDDYLKIANETA